MEDIRQSLKVCLTEWRSWTERVKDFEFSKLKPMHAGWKVADETALGEKVAELLPFANQGHVGSVDNRKIILLALSDPVESVPILQIMQLRPGSSDPLGLDHVAFYCKEMDALKGALKKSEHKWEEQSNPGHSWISLWFGDKQREAKFFDHTSLDLGARELSEVSAAIKTAG